MTSYTPKTYVTGDTLPAADMTTLSAATGSLAGETAALQSTKAPINNPTFTGTVSGVTKAMVGLGNVDNTADASKTLAASQITSGTLAVAQIGTGTPASGAYVDGGTGAWTALPATSDPDAVKLTGNQSIDGVKTFTSAPSVPNDSWAIADTSGLQADLDAKLTIGGDSRPQLPQNWAFFGDSITNIGEGYPFYAQVASKGRLVAEYVQSNPGQDSAFLLSVIDAQIINRTPRPGVCLVLCGANDAIANVTLAAFRANMEEMIRRLRAANIRPIVGTVPPNNNGTADAVVRTYNSWISRWAGRESIPLVDFYTAVGGPSGWKAGLAVLDGLHPSSEGNAALGAAVVTDMELLLQTGGYVVQPRGGGPNLQNNSDFATDTNVDGVPDGVWTNSPTALSVVDDAGVRWVRLTSTGTKVTVNSDEMSASVGDTLKFSALIRSGQSGTTNLTGYELNVTCFTSSYSVAGNFPATSWNGGMSRQIDGATVREFVVPAGTAVIMWSLTGGPDAGTYDIALPTLVNLTALGAL